MPFVVASPDSRKSENTIQPPGFSMRAASENALCLSDPPRTSASWEQTTSQLESGRPVSKYDLSPGIVILSASPASLAREAFHSFSRLPTSMQITLTLCARGGEEGEYLEFVDGGVRHSLSK